MVYSKGNEGSLIDTWKEVLDAWKVVPMPAGLRVVRREYNGSWLIVSDDPRFVFSSRTVKDRTLFDRRPLEERLMEAAESLREEIKAEESRLAEISRLEKAYTRMVNQK